MEQMAHDLRCCFVDDQSAWACLGFRHIGVAVGSLRHPNIPLAGFGDSAAATAFSNLGSFVFRKDAGHLSKHTFRRRLAQPVTHKDDLTAGLLKFFGHDIRISKLAGSAVGRQGQDGLKFPGCHGVTESVKSRSINRSATKALVLVDMVGIDLIVMDTSRGHQGIEL